MSGEYEEGGYQPKWKNKQGRVFGAESGRQQAKASESSDMRLKNEQTKGEGVVKIRKFLAELFKKTEKVNFSDLEKYLDWVVVAYDNYILYKKFKDGQIDLEQDELGVISQAILTGRNNKNLDILTSRSSGPGGQNTQKNESRVQIFHLPTGLMAVSQDERSPEQNKKNETRYLFDMVIKHLDFFKKTVRGKEELSVTLERLCNEAFGDEYRRLDSREMAVVDLLWEDKFGVAPTVLKIEKKNPPLV